MKVSLNKDDKELLIASFNRPDENERDYSIEDLKKCIINNEYSEDDVSYLIEYLDDHFLLHGLENDEPTEYGLKIEKIRDYLYSISN